MILVSITTKSQTTKSPIKTIALTDLHKGVNFGFTAKNGYYDSEEGRQQIDKMAKGGVTWVGVTVYMWQDSFSSTKVYSDYKRTPNDAELERIIQLIHSKGMRVMLYLCLEMDNGEPALAFHKVRKKLVTKLKITGKNGLTVIRNVA